jgi:hypothetical protein
VLVGAVHLEGVAVVPFDGAADLLAVLASGLLLVYHKIVCMISTPSHIIIKAKGSVQRGRKSSGLLRAMANTCTKEICDKLAELMSRGYTQDEVCAELGYNPDTFLEWRKVGGPNYDKDFAKAYRIAKLKQFSWWARRGRDNIGEGKDFNTPLFALYMANMFRWRSAASKDDEVMEELREIKEHLGIVNHT